LKLGRQSAHRSHHRLQQCRQRDDHPWQQDMKIFNKRDGA
jgi:hypothetical protein